jgi:hypothetical protein
MAPARGAPRPALLPSRSGEGAARNAYGAGWAALWRLLPSGSGNGRNWCGGSSWWCLPTPAPPPPSPRRSSPTNPARAHHNCSSMGQLGQGRFPLVLLLAMSSCDGHESLSSFLPPSLSDSQIDLNLGLGFAPWKLLSYPTQFGCPMSGP